MGQFVKGTIVVIPFPFSDLSGSKLRPAFVLADLSGNDIILCQITSQHSRDHLAVSLTLSDLDSGSLPVSSFIRPTRIFTADMNIIVRKAAVANKKVTDKVIQNIIGILKS